MPLLDHFHPPLTDERNWDGFHSNWANVLVDELNLNWLPEGYLAEPQTSRGFLVEVDVATTERRNSLASGRATTATLQAPVWSLAAPTQTMPAAFADTFEVKVIKSLFHKPFGVRWLDTALDGNATNSIQSGVKPPHSKGSASPYGTDSNSEEGPRLVAAIELVSPRNKDRPDSQRVFAVKCASYLAQGISLIVVDVVTSRHFNLHDEIIGLMPSSAAFVFPETPPLYASAYRPIHREDQDQIDLWLVTLAIGESLPKLPLSLTADLILPIDLEGTYLEACRKLRLP